MLEALTEPVLHCTFLTASPLIVSVNARGFFFCFFGLFFCVFFCSSLICGWMYSGEVRAWQQHQQPHQRPATEASTPGLRSKPNRK